MTRAVGIAARARLCAVLLVFVSLVASTALAGETDPMSDESIASLVHIFGFDALLDDFVDDTMKDHGDLSADAQKCMRKGLQGEYQQVISDKVRRTFGNEQDARAWIEFSNTVHGHKFIKFMRFLLESPGSEADSMTVERIQSQFDISDQEFALIRQFLTTPAGAKLRSLGEDFKTGDEGASDRVATQCGLPLEPPVVPNKPGA